MGTASKGAGRPSRILAQLDRDLAELEKRKLIETRARHIQLTALGELELQLAGVTAVRGALKRINGETNTRALDLEGRATSADGGSSPPARSNSRSAS
jgi:hypothetical protein